MEVQEIAKILTDGGAAAAVIIVVLLFIKFISGERESSRIERGETLKVISNHLQHSADVNLEAAQIHREALRELSALCEHRTRAKRNTHDRAGA